jgi:hypothetical protein
MYGKHHIYYANETKHEDCLKIMDTYENMLSELYTEAHGIVFTCQHLKGDFRTLHRSTRIVFTCQHLKGGGQSLHFLLFFCQYL